MLDIINFRVDMGGDPDVVRESQRRRYADVTLVDQVIAHDSEWRQTRGALDDAKKEKNDVQKQIGGFMKKKETPPAELLAGKKAAEEKIAALETKEKELIALRDATIGKIGNLVPDDVPVEKEEEHNPVVDIFGSFEREDWFLSHFDLVTMAGLANTERGSKIAGSRGYFLTGMGMRLNQAIISYAVNFLSSRTYTMIQTPFVMTKSLMGKVAQLADFDEQLYKVTGGAEDQYLIATSEQPLCAYHADEFINPKDLPIKYAGYSTCFRKEAGSHGRDQSGIFRVHQFEKIEQFCITSPEGKESWEMQDAMMGNCKEFYQGLGIPYRVVNMVSGALNDAAAKKYDLEAWFPGSNAHRELVSCSNCTDYQSRRLEVRYGQAGKGDDGKKHYVHMLNSTLVATERALCCIIENYQTKGGIKVPQVLQEYMGGVEFIPFVSVPPPPKKGPAPPQYVPSAEQLAELTGSAEKASLQTYMDGIQPQLNEALNTLAKERPEAPLAALAQLLMAVSQASEGVSLALPPMPAAAGAEGDVSYEATLKAHLAGALHDATKTQPKDPFKAMQQTLYLASLSGADALTAVTAPSAEVTAYEAKYALEASVADCLFKLKKRLVVGPKDGFKFLLSDAGDFFTELSKKLKAAGGDLGLGMTAAELAAKDAADKKAKREKEAKAEAERDAADAENAKRAEALEKSGKKSTGGLHKFDADEVDVHGGAATADDFMDAFGF